MYIARTTAKNISVKQREASNKFQEYINMKNINNATLIILYIILVSIVC